MERLTYSQFQEDIQLLNFWGCKFSGYYVDIGANNGVRDSNTALLEKHGWKGLLIEANPDLIPLASQARPGSLVINSAVVAPNLTGTINFYKVIGGPPNLDGLSTTLISDEFNSKISSYGGDVKVTRVPANTLDTILERNEVPSKFELLSIDVEGAELQVLEGLSLDKYTPRIILVEDNSKGIDLRVRNYLRRFGYIRVHRTGVNDWYVKSEDTIFFYRQRILLILKLLKWRLQHKSSIFFSM
jgi:FkbM family methyltransferase